MQMFNFYIHAIIAANSKPPRKKAGEGNTHTHSVNQTRATVSRDWSTARNITKLRDKIQNIDRTKLPHSAPNAIAKVVKRISRLTNEEEKLLAFKINNIRVLYKAKFNEDGTAKDGNKSNDAKADGSDKYTKEVREELLKTLIDLKEKKATFFTDIRILRQNEIKKQNKLGKRMNNSNNKMQN